MKIVGDWRGLPDGARGAAVAIGNFDGVHRGHQAVLRTATAEAARLGVPAAAAVFAPHPRRVFQPDAPPFRLMSDRLRAETLAAFGVDILYALPFDRDFSQLTDEAFAQRVLGASPDEGLGVKHVVVGADFRFGRGRAGDAERLAAFGARMGFGVTAVSPVGDETPYSSTAVRQALARGDCAAAAAILGRPWTVDGEVVRGAQLGRTYGFPTANIRLGDLLRPRLGVYAVRARLDGAGDWLPGAASMGVRPTVDGKEELLEVYLLDWSGDLYGRRMDVQFIRFLRDEAKFGSIPDMAAQIARDVEDCRRALEQG